MKNLLQTVILFFLCITAVAQTPQMFTYQAVAIDASGSEMKNTQLCIRSSIIKGTFNGTEEWIEVHTSVVTDNFGLFTVNVGSGTPIGGAQSSFENIKWGSTKHFLRIEMSLNPQCTNYILVGTNQMLSVPYAFYTNNAGKSAFADHATTADNANNAQTSVNAKYADTSNVALKALTAVTASSAVDDLDKDPMNEIQQLSLNGKTLSISGGNSVNLNVDDNDADPQNEIQELTFNNNTIGLSKSNTTIDLSNLPGFNASGSDLDYPQGITNAVFKFVPDTLTVPTGQVFYILAAEDEMFLPGVGSSFGRHWTGPNLPIFKPGTVIDECRCIGFFKPIDPFVEPLTIVLKQNGGNFYQVPANKRFVIKSGLSTTTPITLDGYIISPFGSLFKALVIPTGVQIRNISSDEVILTGYLLNN